MRSHIWVMLGFVLFAHGFFLTKKISPTPAKFIKKNLTKKLQLHLQDPKQIVDHTEEKFLEKKPLKSRFLSKKNQQVEKETRARTITQKSTRAKELSLKTLAFSSRDFSELHKKQQEKEESKERSPGPK